MSSMPLDYKFPEDKVVTHYYLPHHKFKKVPTFKWYNAPVFGIGRRSVPMLALDDYLKPETHNLLKEANEELIANKRILEPHMKGLVVNGVVPRHYNGGIESIDNFLLRDFAQPTTWDEQTHIHIKDFDQLSQVKSVFYKKYTLQEFWKGVVHLREFSTFAKKAEPSAWLTYSRAFPTVIRLIESLPFKELGYALCFVAAPNTEVLIHRDTYARDHHFSNFINIQLDGLPKPTFTFDSIHKRRYYLQPYSNFYTFFEGDLHGVDADPVERWMIRVEGKFEDWFAEAIGLENHEAFNWSYSSAQAFLKQRPQGITFYEYES